jgi:hypothetical protein
MPNQNGQPANQHNQQNQPTSKTSKTSQPASQQTMGTILSQPRQLCRISQTAHHRGLVATRYLAPSTRVAVEKAWLTGSCNWELVLKFMLSLQDEASKPAQPDQPAQPAQPVQPGQPGCPTSLAQLLKQYHRSNAVLRAMDAEDQTNLATLVRLATMKRIGLSCFSAEQIKQVLDVMATNCLCINALQPANQPIQARRLGMFNMLSKVNHACRPNCVMVNPLNNNNNILVLVTTEEVQPGQELFIAYMDVDTCWLSREQRRKELFAEHGFVCNCADCADCLDCPST